METNESHEKGRLGGSSGLMQRLLLVLALAIGFSATLSSSPAAAAMPDAVHPAGAQSATTTVAAGTAMVPMAWGDCVTSARRGGNAYMKLFYALSNWRCGSTVIGAAGTASAGHICWGSQQWWGYTYRWVVWMITGGQYTRC